MGLFDLFKSSSKTILVVDAVSLNESAGSKGNKVPPRNQLQMLRRLARFSQREKMELVAVLSGTPLNKAPGGKKFENIMVLYSASAEAHAKFLAKTVSSKGSGAVLISGNAAAEKLLATGTKSLRVSTFRKAFDVGGDGDGDDRGDNQRGRGGNNNRPQRRRQQKPAGEKQQQQKQQQDRRPPKESSESDAINELIDLVD